MDSKVEGNIQRGEGVMNVQRVGGGWRDGDRERGRLVLTPVVWEGGMREGQERG